MILPPFPDRIHFSIAFPMVPEPMSEVWEMLTSFLAESRTLPKQFEVSQITGHPRELQSNASLKLSPQEVEGLILNRKLTGFWVDTGHTARSVAFHLVHAKGAAFHAALGCRIELKAKAPDDWAGLLERLMVRWPSVGAWQWRHLYQVWQGIEEVHDHYESQFGALPAGYVKSYKKVRAFTPKPDRVFIDISKNPGRPKELLPRIFFYPSAEMWLGRHFWEYAKCTKEEVLAADFFLEKRDTPNFLYLKSWQGPFTRPDGEQGRQQQRLWQLLFHEDCEWPPGSGGICDEPMFGPPELMPKENRP